MAPTAVDVHQAAPDGVDGADDGNRPPRLPRWTKHDILVLIQAKHVAENQIRRSRTGDSAFRASIVPEPKWNSVSSYCKRHGVNREPVQCLKRWSNLTGDFKKIREWESQSREENESFWVLRSDLRRERKLPGFFDKEVYDILDGRAVMAPALTEMMALDIVKDSEEVMATAPEEEEEEEAVFDSGRTAAVENGLFSDFEQSGQDDDGGSPGKEMVAMESPITTLPAPFPISEKQYQPFSRDNFAKGTTKEKHPSSNPEKGSPSHVGRKRRRFSSEGDGETNLQDQLIKVLKRNGCMLSAQLEAQNINCQMDRDQHKNQTDSLVAVLGKLADAIGRIADKL